MAERTIPEPPDGARVLIGEPPIQVLLVRDDGAAASARQWTEADWSNLAADARWWPVQDDALCLTWHQVAHPDPYVYDGLPALDRAAIRRLFDRSEMDVAVARARAEGAGLTVLGEHLIEPGGYCRTDDTRHSPEEIARLEDRLAAEPSGVQAAAETLARLAGGGQSRG